jgi:hypothetical protein
MRVMISRQAKEAIASRAQGYLLTDHCTRQADGTFSVEFQQSTIDRVTELALSGETLSDTIVRICAVSGRGLN